MIELFWGVAIVVCFEAWAWVAIALLVSLLNLRHHQGTEWAMLELQPWRPSTFCWRAIIRLFLVLSFLYHFLSTFSFPPLHCSLFVSFRSKKPRSTFLHRMPHNLFPLRTLLPQRLPLLLLLLLLLHPFPSLIWCCRLLRLRQAIPLPPRRSPPPTLLPRFLFSRQKLPPSPSITCRACPWHRCPP